MMKIQMNELMGRFDKDCEPSYSNPILRNRHSDEVTDLLTAACTDNATAKLAPATQSISAESTAVGAVRQSVLVPK